MSDDPKTQIAIKRIESYRAGRALRTGKTPPPLPGRDELAQLIKDGASRTDLLRRYSMSQPTLQRLFELYGIEPPHSKQGLRRVEPIKPSSETFAEALGMNDTMPVRTLAEIRAGNAQTASASKPVTVARPSVPTVLEKLRDRLSKPVLEQHISAGQTVAEIAARYRTETTTLRRLAEDYMVRLPGPSVPDPRVKPQPVKAPLAEPRASESPEPQVPTKSPEPQIPTKSPEPQVPTPPVSLRIDQTGSGEELARVLYGASALTAGLGSSTVTLTLKLWVSPDGSGQK